MKAGDKDITTSAKAGKEMGNSQESLCRAALPKRMAEKFLSSTGDVLGRVQCPQS